MCQIEWKKTCIGLKQLLGTSEAGPLLSAPSSHRWPAAHCHLRSLCFEKSDPKWKGKRTGELDVSRDRSPFVAILPVLSIYFHPKERVLTSLKVSHGCVFSPRYALPQELPPGGEEDSLQALPSLCPRLHPPFRQDHPDGVGSPREHLLQALLLLRERVQSHRHQGAGTTGECLGGLRAHAGLLGSAASAEGVGWGWRSHRGLSGTFSKLVAQIQDMGWPCSLTVRELGVRICRLSWARVIWAPAGGS